ncbi:MAG TPA: endonuclease NucS domain-containing protein [Tepidisphaeraceae bacterium]|nr:endonuclease NucS domain-containing protein [Tepidisphaeraceae bacterium]
MESQVYKYFPFREACQFAERHGLSAEATVIQEMEIEWDRKYTTSVKKGRIAELFESRGLLSQFMKEVWPDGYSARGEAESRKYARIWQEYQAFLSNGSLPIDEPEQEEDTSQFALEAHLRDFLAKNLERIESGLRLYQKDDVDGIEYSIDGGQGRIDLLAIDRNGKYVVIELKLSRGRNKTLGQLLYYMGWVDKHLGNGPCRGAIIASEITDDLIIASSRVPGVFIAKYMMSFSIERIT